MVRRNNYKNQNLVIHVGMYIEKRQLCLFKAVLLVVEQKILTESVTPQLQSMFQLQHQCTTTFSPQL